MKHLSKKELFSIPNLMGYFRLVMIPVFVWLYLHAVTDADYYRAALVMGISSITDMFDGMVARKFNMITEFGKFLDPLADKLTHGAILLCLLSRYPLILLLVVLFVAKEGRHQAAPGQKARRRHVVWEMLHRPAFCSPLPFPPVPPYAYPSGQWADPAVRGSDGGDSCDVCTGV